MTIWGVVSIGMISLNLELLPFPLLQCLPKGTVVPKVFRLPFSTLTYSSQSHNGSTLREGVMDFFLSFYLSFVVCLAPKSLLHRMILNEYMKIPKVDDLL